MVGDGSTAVVLAEQHAEIALSLTENVIVLERGAIVHRARSADMLKDAGALDQFIGLHIVERG
jgi:branched-chain amino acid transport system ATP-binding protein